MIRTYLYFFFFNDTATTEIYTLSLHDALPIHRQSRLRPECEPGETRRTSDDAHDRHEDRGDPVGQPLNGGTRGLRVFDESHDARQRRLAAHVGGAEEQGAGLIHRTGDDPGLGGLLDRQAFTREHRLVDRRRSLQDDAVRRGGLAGPEGGWRAPPELGCGHVAPWPRA